MRSMMNLTGADVRSGVNAVRGSCSIADIYLERYQSTHDEHLRELELGGVAYDLACEYMEKFEQHLEQLEGVEIEDLPAQGMQIIRPPSDLLLALFD